MVGRCWETTSLLERPCFRGELFREGTISSPELSSNSKPKHLLRGDPSCTCGHRTSDLKVKGVVWPSTARFKFKRCLPHNCPTQGTLLGTITYPLPEFGTFESTMFLFPKVVVYVSSLEITSTNQSHDAAHMFFIDVMTLAAKHAESMSDWQQKCGAIPWSHWFADDFGTPFKSFPSENGKHIHRLHFQFSSSQKPSPDFIGLVNLSSSFIFHMTCLLSSPGHLKICSPSLTYQCI